MNSPSLPHPPIRSAAPAAERSVGRSAPKWSAWLVPLLLIASLSGTSAGESLDAKARESLIKMFGDSVTIVRSTLRLTPQESDSIALRSKTRWAGDSVRVFTCRVHNSAIGFGFLDEVRGKTQLITYLVGVYPDGRVNDVDVLVYRESYGGEITYTTFREQFRQKSNKDNLTAGKNIKNISGATISVRAVTDGVRRVLATFEALRPILGD